MSRMECCLNEILLELMEDKKLTTWKLHLETGIPESQIRSWLLMGKHQKNCNPKVTPELYKIAEYFQVPLVYLLFGIWEENFKLNYEAC